MQNVFDTILKYVLTPFFPLPLAHYLFYVHSKNSKKRSVSILFSLGSTKNVPVCSRPLAAALLSNTVCLQGSVSDQPKKAPRQEPFFFLLLSFIFSTARP